ncbi:hypothetical protein [Aneurinibacillus terranovensis]|uniref:hypothetical protein n=1 Tax=Aneurinibacillus terranovensis TaxID=278991 RepID=UPI000486229F|nr:hypothetical protein [Aneurinibacillus terranovensis]
MKHLLALSFSALLFANGCANAGGAVPQHSRMVSSHYTGSHKGLDVKAVAEIREVIALSPSLEVEHSIEGRTLQLYFNTKNIKLTTDRAGAPNHIAVGHIDLYVDGQKTRRFTSEAEVRLQPGKHKIAVELADNHQTPFPGSRIEFEVVIS